MDLSYFGMSCFQIKTEKVSVVTDPFDPGTLGIELPKLSADIVVLTAGKTMSKGAGEHIVPSELRSGKELKLLEVSEPGEYEAGGIFVRSFGNPLIHIITIEDINVCYIGLLGSKFPAADVSEIGNIDYMIVPVGDGGMFPDWKAVEKLIKDIDPSVVIPCAYKIRGMAEKYSKLKGVNDFMKEMGIVDVKTSKKLKLQPFPEVEEKKAQYIVMDVTK